METEKVIALRLRNLSDLVDADPSPLQQGVLRPEAETYIVREAKRLPGAQPIRLAVEVPSAGTEEAESAGKAVRTHFQRAAGSETDNMRELFRNGFKALLIGLLMLSICLLLAWYFTYQLPKRHQPAHSGEFRDSGMGVHVEADRDFSLRVASVCKAPKVVPAPLGCFGHGPAGRPGPRQSRIILEILIRLFSAPASKPPASDS